MTTKLHAALSGTLLYATAAAAYAIGHDVPYPLGLNWWVLGGPAAILHAVAGFLAIGGRQAFRENQWHLAAGATALSVVIAIACWAGVCVLVSNFPVKMAAGPSLALLIASIAGLAYCVKSVADNTAA